MPRFINLLLINMALCCDNWYKYWDQIYGSHRECSVKYVHGFLVFCCVVVILPLPMNYMSYVCLIARLMGPTWGPSGADRTQVGPMLPHEPCFLGWFNAKKNVTPVHYHSFALTHLPFNKMAAISQTIFSDAFSWMKIFIFWLKFHRSLFPKVQLTITQHWFK